MKTIKEQYLLILSILKWAILSILVGGITGLITTFFIKTLEFSTTMIQSYSFYFLLLPIIFFLSSYLNQYLPKELQGQGKIIEQVNKGTGKISFIIVPIRFLSTLLTLSFGGSCGKVGPCAQMGAGAASTTRFLKLSQED